MTDEFNEDLLKEALDFDLDDFAIDNLVAGLENPNQDPQTIAAEDEAGIIDMDDIQVDTGHLLQHNTQM